MYLVKYLYIIQFSFHLIDLALISVPLNVSAWYLDQFLLFISLRSSHTSELVGVQLFLADVWFGVWKCLNAVCLRSPHIYSLMGVYEVTSAEVCGIQLEFLCNWPKHLLFYLSVIWGIVTVLWPRDPKCLTFSA